MTDTAVGAGIAPERIVSIEGEFDLARVGELRTRFLETLEHGDLGVDLGRSTTCDLPALQLLWAARASARAKNRRFVVLGTSSVVDEAAVALGMNLAELVEKP